ARSARAAESLSLALRELASNAMKHGPLGMAGGHVDVTWTVEGEGEGGLLKLVWAEHVNGEIGRAPTRTASAWSCSRACCRTNSTQAPTWNSVPADFASPSRCLSHTRSARPDSVDLSAACRSGLHTAKP